MTQVSNVPILFCLTYKSSGSWVRVSWHRGCDRQLIRDSCDGKALTMAPPNYTDGELGVFVVGVPWLLNRTGMVVGSESE